MNEKMNKKVGEHQSFFKMNAFGISVLLTFLNILPSPLAFAGGDTVLAGSQTTAVATKTPGQTADSAAVSPTRTVYTLGDSSPISDPKGGGEACPDCGHVVSGSMTPRAILPANKFAAATDKAAAAVTSAQQALDKAAAATASAKTKVETAKAAVFTAQEAKTAMARIVADKQALADKASSEVEDARQAILGPAMDASNTKIAYEKAKTEATEALKSKTAAAKIAKEKKGAADKALAEAAKAKTEALKAETAVAAAQTALEKAKTAVAAAPKISTTAARTDAAKKILVDKAIAAAQAGLEKAQAALASAQQTKTAKDQIAADKKVLADDAVANSNAANQAALKSAADSDAAQAEVAKAKTAMKEALKIKTAADKISKDKQTLAKKAAAEAVTAKKAALKAETAVAAAQTAVGKAETAVAKAQQTQSTAAKTVADKKALADQAAAKEITALAVARKADEAREPNFSSLASNPALAPFLPSLKPLTSPPVPDPSVVEAVARFANADGTVPEEKLEALAQFIQAAIHPYFFPARRTITADMLRGVRLVTRADQLSIKILRVMQENRLNFVPLALIFPNGEASRDFTQAFIGNPSWTDQGGAIASAYIMPGHPFASFPGLAIAGGAGSADRDATAFHELRHTIDPHLLSGFDRREMLAQAAGSFLNRQSYLSVAPTESPAREAAMAFMASNNTLIRLANDGSGAGTDGSTPIQEQLANTLGRLYARLPGYILDRILYNSPTAEAFLQWAAVTDAELDEIRKLSPVSSQPR